MAQYSFTEAGSGDSSNEPRSASLTLAEAFALVVKQHNDTAASWLQMWAQQTQQHLCHIRDNPLLNPMPCNKAPSGFLATSPQWPFSALNWHCSSALEAVENDMSSWSHYAARLSKSAQAMVSQVSAHSREILTKMQSQGALASDTLKPVYLGQHVRVKQGEAAMEHMLKKASAWASFCEEQAHLWVGDRANSAR